jgi:tetratricopeptide (TPR) repeat protein
MVNIDAGFDVLSGAGGETSRSHRADQGMKAIFRLEIRTVACGLRRHFFPILFILFLIAPIGVSAQADNRLDAIQLLQKGDLALRLGNSEEAYMHYTNAIQLDKAFADAYMKRANLLTRTGRYNEALQDMDIAYELNPMSEYILDNRAKLNMLMTEYKDGMLIGESSDYSKEMRLDRIDAWIDAGRPDTALVQLDSLINEHPHDTLLHLKKGFIHLDLNAMDSALVAAERTLSLNSRSPYAHDLRGLALMRLGRYQEAVAAFTAAITSWPAFEMAYFNRATAYRALGMNDAALHDMDTAMKFGQDKVHFLVNRALIRKEMGNLEGAEADYTAALQVDPLSADLHFNRSFARKHLGDRAGAMRDAEAALGLNQSDPKAWNLKGDLHTLFGEYMEAIEHYSRAINLSTDPAVDYYDRGMAYLMSYRLLQGCDDLRRAQEMGLPQAEEGIQYFCHF